MEARLSGLPSHIEDFLAPAIYRSVVVCDESGAQCIELSLHFAHFLAHLIHLGQWNCYAVHELHADAQQCASSLCFDPMKAFQLCGIADLLSTQLGNFFWWDLSPCSKLQIVSGQANLPAPNVKVCMYNTQLSQMVDLGGIGLCHGALRKEVHHSPKGVTHPKG